ncbi:MAG: sulfite exporter TauE/SafE family protein [Clostridia bacterium]|nr:sulfite exporter TauE/SafE family protein [Clostridia bacterium]
MQYVIYFLLALFATSVGSLTGMGGGVIIKPLMDVLGDYNVQTIGVISSITVFSMALVSVAKQIKAKTKIPFETAIPLGFGSVFGGFIGERVLSYIVNALKINGIVTVIQNTILAILILCVFLYMKNKNRIKSKELKGAFVSLAVGIFLGVCSSFLGIGGGPINVALIIYLFSVNTKTATVCSLITILFAQISKLTTVAFTTGFSEFDLSVAPLMIIGAILGGFLGASLNKKCKEETVEKAFNGVQLLVLAITIFNILKAILMIGR